MKLKELKDLLNSIPEEKLNSNLYYKSEELSISGQVKAICKATENLYWDGEDDPSRLMTKKEVIEEYGESPSEMGFEVEIRKGEFYIEF